AMEPGETSNVLPSARGLTLLYCEYILPPLERSPEEIQQLARERVEGRTFGARWSELEARLRDEGNLRIHWKRLGGETRTDGAGEEPFAEAVGEGWTVSDLEALLGEELVGTPHGDDRRRLEDRIEGFLIDRLKIREVWLRGLAGDPAMTDGRRWVETQILAGQAMIALVAERVEPPTAPQIETHYAAHADAFVTEERFRLSLISVAKGEDPAAAADLLWSIRHSLRADPDRFGALALIHSTDPSAARGGDLGWVPRGRLARGMGLDALQEVISLGNGEISEMIDGGDAFQLLRLEDREAPRTQTLQEAWPRVENRIGQARVERARREIAEEWLEALEIRWPESEDRP
ncbi:MAG: peptidyl-prolyl cis-trans isomerase, partial [Acidobacteriota bacterium]